MDRKHVFISEDSGCIDNAFFAEVVSPDEGVKYTYLDYANMTEEAIQALTEADKKDAKPGVLGKVKMSVMGRADVSTRNGTVYPFAILKREIDKLNATTVARRGCFMAADHPSWREDYRVSFKNSAAYITQLSIDAETGIVSGEAIIIDKGSGQDVASTFRADAFVGVSSRGWGSTSEDDLDGLHGPVSGRILQDNFTLEGYDFVLDPSVRGASIDTMTENNQRNNGVTVMNRDKLKKDFPELYEAIVAEGKQAAVDQLTGEDGAYVSRDLHEAKAADLSKVEGLLEGMTKERDELSKSLETKTTECVGVSESRDALEAEKKALEESAAKTKVDADRAAADLMVAEALGAHPHREAIKGRLTDTDLLSEETAKTALGREKKYIEDLGIPASPINIENLQRTGKPPAQEDPKASEESELTEAQKRAYVRAGIRSPIED